MFKVVARKCETKIAVICSSDDDFHLTSLSDIETESCCLWFVICDQLSSKHRRVIKHEEIRERKWPSLIDRWCGSWTQTQTAKQPKKFYSDRNTETTSIHKNRKHSQCCKQEPNENTSDRQRNRHKQPKKERHTDDTQSDRIINWQTNTINPIPRVSYKFCIQQFCTPVKQIPIGIVLFVHLYRWPHWNSFRTPISMT